MRTSPRCLCCGEPLDTACPPYHARCLKRLFHSTRIPAFNYSQEELNTLAKETILKRVSVPGVQPKLSLHLEKGSKEEPLRLTLVGLEGDFILKPQANNLPFLPEAEHFCMLLARKCGITTADFGLIPLKSGEYAYITRRMDRTAEGPLHMEDFCQILNKLTEQKYNGSMEQVGKAIRKYSDNAGLDAIRFFEIAIFSYLTGNSDMHLKNFSLLRLQDGHYELAPAYDLVPVKVVFPQDDEELALTLNGKKNNLRRADWQQFGTALKLTSVQMTRAIERLVTKMDQSMDSVLKASFLPAEMQRQCAELISQRMLRLTQ